jgi:ankyrin repeat protein
MGCTDINSRAGEREYYNTAMKMHIVNDYETEAIALLELGFRPKSRLNPNLPDINGRNDLMLAIIFDMQMLFEKLIENRVLLALDLNARDNVGFTALHYTVLLRRSHMMAVLKTAGASHQLVDKRGRVPEDLLNSKAEAELQQLMTDCSIELNRDIRSKLNCMMTAEDGDAYPLFTQEGADDCLTKVGAKTKIGPKNSRLITEQFANLLKQTKYHIVANKNAADFPKNKIYFINRKDFSSKHKASKSRRMTDMMSRLSDSSVEARQIHQYFTNTVANFSGITLKEHILNPQRTETVRRLCQFSNEALHELVQQQPHLPKTWPMLLTAFKRKKDASMLTLQYLQLDPLEDIVPEEAPDKGVKSGQLAKPSRQRGKS